MGIPKILSTFFIGNSHKIDHFSVARVNKTYGNPPHKKNNFHRFLVPKLGIPKLFKVFDIHTKMNK